MQRTTSGQRSDRPQDLFHEAADGFEEIEMTTATLSVATSEASVPNFQLDIKHMLALRDKNLQSTMNTNYTSLPQSFPMAIQLPAFQW